MPETSDQQPPLVIQCATVGSPLQIRSSRGFEWTHLELPVPGLAPALDGLRIVHLTDLHCRKWWDPAYDDLIAKLKSNPPDMLLFTGDFVECKYDSRPAIPTVKKLLSQFASRLGIFAILGNHDGDLVRPRLADCNLTFLDHRRIYLHSGDATIELIGLVGVDRYDLDRPWISTLGQKQPGTLRIVMCHYPDTLPKVQDLAPDLYLTGHTHGGQVALPNRMPILRHDTLPRHLCTGIHRAYGTVLVANRGFGFTTPLMLRMFCPAEVVEITIRSVPF
jgi:predicted MPP superfamily phosphohydrolase